MKSPFSSKKTQTKLEDVDPAAAQDDSAQCPATVNETVCIPADVTITPQVDVGSIESFCVNGPVIGACPGTVSPTGNCTFTVSQNICVQVPLTFSATAVATPSGIVCGTPEAGLCSQSTGCTHTIGYYQTHPAVTNALIESAGGEIILGIDETGSSFTVTTANSNAVLSFLTPSPPAPPSPPLHQQYEQLYAQLLAANLNIINGATCEFALQAISDANLFLATSPYGVGKEGAPLVEAPLEQYNSGNGTGCPAECP